MFSNNSLGSRKPSLHCQQHLNERRAIEEFAGDLLQESEAMENRSEHRLNIYMFLRILRTHFCIASGSLGKLYTQFNLCTASYGSRTIVATPDKKDKGIEGISHDAIESTPIYILDGHLVGLKGLALSVQEDSGFSVLPFEDGIDLLNGTYADDGYYLPVLSTRQLRCVGSLAMVKLSRLQPSLLENHVQQKIQPAIMKKLGYQPYDQISLN